MDATKERVNDLLIREFGEVRHPGWSAVFGEHAGWTGIFAINMNDWELEEVMKEVDPGKDWRHVSPITLRGTDGRLLCIPPAGFPFFFAAHLWQAVNAPVDLDAGLYMLENWLKRGVSSAYSPNHWRVQREILTEGQVSAIREVIRYLIDADIFWESSTRDFPLWFPEEADSAT